MGQGGSSSKLTKTDLKKLIDETHFSSDEISKLYEQFKSISSSQEDDGVIDKSEFQQALGLKDSLFVDRMFSLFDDNKDGNINFEEFVRGLSVFCEKGTIEEKLKFSFKIYCFDDEDYITKKRAF